MSYTTYLFDFDYTLADSSKGIVTCFQIVLNRHGYSNITDNTIKRTIGKTLEESFSILTGVSDAAQLNAFKKEYVEEANEHMTVNTVLFAETKEVLTALKEKGAHIGIISTKYRYRIKEMIDLHFPDQFFDLIIGGEDVNAAKPSPEGVKLAMQRLQTVPAETLYIGDSTVDAETAQAVGVDFAGVLHGMTTKEELQIYPHYKIMDTLEDLLMNDEEVEKVDQLKKKKPIKKKKSLVKIVLPVLLLLAAIEIITAESYYLLIIFIIISISTIKQRNLPPAIFKWISPVWKRCKTYHRFLHCKQLNGVPSKKNSSSSTTCQNCGNTYTGNYCNRCGQDSKTGRFSFRYIIKNALGGLSNIDNGFWRTLIELLYRPGYMINDFIKGKRIHYFRPFQTLFVLAAIYILLVQLANPYVPQKETPQLSKSEQLTIAKQQIQQRLDTIKDTQSKKALTLILNSLGENTTRANEDSTQTVSLKLKGKEISKDKNSIADFNDTQTEIIEHMKKQLDSMPFLQKVWNLLQSWAHGNKTAGIMCTLPLFALATRMTFRRRKYHHNLNMTEHLFIQTYIAAQILLISIIYLPFNDKAGVDLYDIPAWSIFLLFWWDYQQLFHTTWLKSLLRTALMFFYSLLIIIILAIISIVLLIVGVYLLKALGF